ncbi:hypothetical protein D8Y22_03955 [Salinadaptatus halalkaliphilus]|uniref:Uncharacterized protein n=1 Tax=Salinadaptatus halalkaliphilus TaxID=2419781 RepID=A0A4S3TU82_9EURY|nr:hypothetical protein [Salinadaptatus halalkaliphilus]THE66208.1 hypothetical protein D8Y22_03955 [Salinadaptatus halalkaliphilus]
MEFTVSRAGTTLVTLHGGADATACDDAGDELADTLASLEADGPVLDWSVDDTDIYEHPTAPFDPYTITVTFTITISVEAEDEATAADIGASVIDDTLATADVETVSYSSPPTASAA